jgi:hypothetical protein
MVSVDEVTLDIRRMGRSTVHLVLAVTLGSVPTDARAEAEVTVMRTQADTAACPDDAELRRMATASRVPSAAAPTHRYRVSFERENRAYLAAIVDETAGRTRSLEDKGPGCAALGQAAAVVLATMWETERDELIANPVAPPSPVLPADRSARLPLMRSPASQWLLGAGSGVATAILRPAAPTLMADAALDRAPLSLAIGALWIPQQRLGLASGAVTVQLAAGSLRGCAFAWTVTRLGVCARVLAGALQAEASGFDANMRRTRPWFAAGAEVFVDAALPVAPLRCRAAAGAIVPLHAEAFSVAGVGSAYRTPAVGALFTLSIELGFSTRARGSGGAGP